MNTENTAPTAAGRATTGPRAMMVLGGIFLIQLALIAYFYWPAQTESAVGGTLLSGFDPTAVSTLQIEDQAGQSVTLQRQDDGWTVAGTGGYPANATKADDVLTRLLAIHTNRQVTRTPASHARLQVADTSFNRRITMRNADDLETVVYLGVSAGGASTHVRLADDDAVYLTSEIAAWETEPFLSGWVSTSYFSTQADSILAYSIHNAQGEFNFSRDPSGAWQAPELNLDAPLDTGEVNSLAASLSFINLLNVLGNEPPPGFSPQTAAATVELVLDPQSTPDQDEIVTLYFGSIPDEDGTDETYFVKSSTSDYYVAISSFLAERIINLANHDLIITENINTDSIEPESNNEEAFPEGLFTPLLPEDIEPGADNALIPSDTVDALDTDEQDTDSEGENTEPGADDSDDADADADADTDETPESDTP